MGLRSSSCCSVLSGAAVLVVALFSATAGAATFTRAPYLQAVRPDGVIVVWETDEPSTGEVDVGATDAYGLVVASSTPATHHEVRLEGLEPGTLAYYRVRMDGAADGVAGTFQTLPVASVPFDFLVYGDTRSDHATHAEVIASMMQHPALFALHSGDMVGSGENDEEWTTFFEVEAPLLAHVPMFGVPGNHEETGALSMPDTYLRAMVPPDDAEAETYYSFDVSNVHVIALDGHDYVLPEIFCVDVVYDWGYCFDEQQMSWLEADLAAVGADPKIDHVVVMMHIGPYSSKPGRTGSAQLRMLLNDFAANKVKLIVSGHDHYYEHGVAGNGIHYVISGGGGAGLYETDPESTSYAHEVLVSTSEHNFLAVHVDGQKIHVEGRDAANVLIEAFDIAPHPICDETLDCAGNDQPGVCAGSWECSATSACLWLCDLGGSCENTVNCGPPPEEARCAGAWDCVNETCAWICDPSLECSIDAHCADKEALDDCFQGHWACVKSACEWTCHEPQCATDEDCVAAELPATCAEATHAACDGGLCVCAADPVVEVAAEVGPEVVDDSVAPETAVEVSSPEPDDEDDGGDSGSCAYGGATHGLPGQGPGPIAALLLLFALLLSLRYRQARVTA